jgi:hypothetical protein
LRKLACESIILTESKELARPLLRGRKPRQQG